MKFIQEFFIRKLFGKKLFSYVYTYIGRIKGLNTLLNLILHKKGFFSIKRKGIQKGILS